MNKKTIKIHFKYCIRKEMKYYLKCKGLIIIYNMKKHCM